MLGNENVLRRKKYGYDPTGYRRLAHRQARDSAPILLLQVEPMVGSSFRCRNSADTRFNMKFAPRLNRG